MKSKQTRRARAGFTLIELLIVIAIITFLSVIVVLTLNPAQLLRQSRDSARIADMATIKSAIALYLADVSSPNIGTNATCYASQASTTFVSCSGRGTATATSAQSGAFNVAGTGWIDIDFTGISSGSPLGTEPRDPTNSTSLYYVYIPDTTNMTYEVNADMESTRYANGGGNDVEINTFDGGNSTTLYEVGTDPGLDL